MKTTLTLPKPKLKKTKKQFTDIVKTTSGSLSHNKPDVRDIPIVQLSKQKTAEAGKSYTARSGFAAIRRWAMQLAAVAVVGMLAAYVPPTLIQPAADLQASISIVSAWGDSNVEVWWPADQASVQGTQPFKALLSNSTVDKYKMFWQVDGGQKNEMFNSFTDWPHKEASVDLSGWNWKGSGPYTVTFAAEDFSGNKLGARYQTIYINKTEVKSVSQQTAVQPAATQPVSAVQTQITTQVVSSAPATDGQAAAVIGARLDVWWPVSGVAVSGKTPFKVMLQNTAVSDYKAYWQVDGKAWSELSTNYTDYPHKEAVVDVTSWNWNGSGSYTVTFVAKNNAGAEIGRAAVTVTNASPAPISVTATTQTTQNPTTSTITTASVTTTSKTNSTLLSGAKLYVNPNSNAKKTADAWRSSRPTDALYMDKVASGAESKWLGNWNSNVQSDASAYTTAVTSAGALPVFVLYNLPQRDCGGWSAGNTGADAYKQWVRSIAAGIGNRKAVVVLEPDGLALIGCLSATDLQTRYGLLRDAVSVFKNNGQAVYLDAGHPGWVPAADMAGRLKLAGIDQADGFALNVSNFITTAENTSYGQQISSHLGGKHFVVDTSRNGSGPTSDYQWCNPAGRSLGLKPNTNTGNSLVDAYLWLKTPGESDGGCNGGPSAGTFWPDYALGLGQRTAW